MSDFFQTGTGEFCMITDLARVNRIPWDWGLEVGSLAEVHRNYSPRRVCQVDICKSIFRTLASEGVVFSDGLFTSLLVSYLRQAEDTIQKYEADAAINGLQFDRAISMATQAFIENPMTTPLIPNWNRVTSAIPDIFDMLKMAVDADNQ